MAGCRAAGRAGFHLTDGLLSPLPVPPVHPLTLARYAGRQRVRDLARRFETDEAGGLFAGLAAHSTCRSAPPTAGYGLMLAILGHLVGWPMARGGSQSIADAWSLLEERAGTSNATGRSVAVRASVGPRPRFSSTSPLAR